MSKSKLEEIQKKRNRVSYEKEYFLRMLHDIESNVHRGPQDEAEWRPDPTLEVDKVMLKASTKEVDRMLLNTYPKSVAALSSISFDSTSSIRLPHR